MKMRVTVERFIFIILIFLATFIVYWSGFGGYITMGAFRMLPATNFFSWTERNGTNIANTSILLQISGNVYITTLAPDKSRNKSAKVDNRTSSLEKPRNESAKVDNRTSGKLRNESLKVDNRTIALDSSHNASAKINGSLNITLYITPVNLRNGRLGNQMFRYASLLGIARHQGRQLIVAPGSELQDTFKIQHVGVKEESKGWKVISESSANSFDTKLMNLPAENLQLDGFLQSYKYFESIPDEIRQEFVFQDAIANEADKILHDIYIKYKSSLFVAVHARRGDFLNEDKQRLGYGVPQKSYFMKAFDWMKSKFPARNVTFLVASDDLEWCKKNLIGNNVIALPDASPAVHIAVLSSCDHAVLSGGTFGWWIAWLTGGHVIYFRGFMQKGTTFGDSFAPADYYPRLWIGFDN